MLILASASPRRHQLLLAAGFEHVVRVSDVPEDRLSGEEPTAFVQRIAEAKARAVESGQDDIVLAADTVVCIDGETLGKPRNDEDARRMLRLLSGKDHWVYTGICILRVGQAEHDLGATKVSFTSLHDDEIEEYTRSGEPRDKAGAYGIQGLASRFVPKIEGCYHNVMGLPLALVYKHLRKQ